MSGKPISFDLTGRHAVVTGGNSGLGHGITEGLLHAGADVTIFARSPLPNDLQNLAASLGRTIEARPVDLADAERTREAAVSLINRQQVDILVNNSGGQRRNPAVDFPLDDFDYVMNVNLRSVFVLCQTFGRPMLERRDGKIINVASLLSFQGGVRVPAYAASKGALAQLTKALCNEWASSGVNVNAIAPGYMDTRLNAALMDDSERFRQISERIPAGRWGEATDVAGAVVFLASTASNYINGAILPVDGGWLSR